MDGTRSSVILDLQTRKAGCVVATLENLTPKLAHQLGKDDNPLPHYQEIQKFREYPQEKLVEQYHQKYSPKKPIRTSFIQKIDQSFKQQTISSLMHKGRESDAMNHPTAKKSFVEALKERQSKEKEGKQGKGGHSK